jgi:hypothetical protein
MVENGELTPADEPVGSGSQSAQQSLTKASPCRRAKLKRHA